MFKKIIYILSNMKTQHLVVLPIAIGISVLLIALGLGKTSHIGNQIGRFLLPLGFFVWGFTGLPMILRKEVPWLITIRGWAAVAQGVFLMLGSWSIAIILLVVLLRSG